MKKTILTIVTTCMAMFANAQITESLVAEGFENVKVVDEGGVSYLTFEDNIYRDTYRGVNKALNVALKNVESGKGLDVVVAALEEPQLHISVDAATVGQYQGGVCSLADVYSSMTIDLNYDESWKVLNRSGVDKTNSSSWKMDFVVYPELMLSNTTFDALYKYYFNLAPALEMQLWKGAKLTLQAEFPIVTNLKGQYKKVRPGFITLEQNFYLTHGFSVRLVGGNFNNNRAGGLLCAKWMSNDGRWTLGANAGATVQSIVTSEQGWTFSKKLRTSFKAYATYYLPVFDTELTLQANRYVFGDFGLRGDITRHFGAATVGVYAMLVEKEINGGFHFSVPLPGKKFMAHRTARIRPANSWGMEYVINSLWSGEEMRDDYGKTFKASPDESANRRFYQPDYIRHFIIKNAE